jgi:hypothetical protein
MIEIIIAHHMSLSDMSKREPLMRSMGFGGIKEAPH